MLQQPLITTNESFFSREFVTNAQHRVRILNMEIPVSTAVQVQLFPAPILHKPEYIQNPIIYQICCNYKRLSFGTDDKD